MWLKHALLKLGVPELFFICAGPSRLSCDCLLVTSSARVCGGHSHLSDTDNCPNSITANDNTPKSSTNTPKSQTQHNFPLVTSAKRRFVNAASKTGAFRRRHDAASPSYQEIPTPTGVTLNKPLLTGTNKGPLVSHGVKLQTRSFITEPGQSWRQSVWARQPCQPITEQSVQAARVSPQIPHQTLWRPHSTQNICLPDNGLPSLRLPPTTPHAYREIT